MRVFLFAAAFAFVAGTVGAGPIHAVGKAAASCPVVKSVGWVGKQAGKGAVATGKAAGKGVAKAGHGLAWVGKKLY